MIETFLDRYETLNQEQKQAVDTTEGPVLVVAGPGSGKTELLSLRVANILRQHDVAPNNILCLTFTEAAARNMRQRLQGLIGVDAHRVAIHTFHSFGADVLNQYPEFFYNGATFEPADEMVQIEVLEEILGNLTYDSPLKKQHNETYVYLNAIKSSIDALKKAGLTPSEFRSIIEHNEREMGRVQEDVNATFGQRLSKKRLSEVHELVNSFERIAAETEAPHTYYADVMSVLADSLQIALQDAEAAEKTTPVSEWKRTYVTKDEGIHRLKSQMYLRKLYDLADVYEQYQARMKERRYFDFSDMLLDTVQEMLQNERLRSELQEQYEFILVDEFQDTNDAQLRLLETLAQDQTKPNLMAVGDDDQAIFKFQGADVSNILHFRDVYPDAHVITLQHNYRSREEIIRLARSVIQHGEERLEQYYTELHKYLHASRDISEGGEIYTPQFETEEAEYVWIAKEIQRLIQEEWQLAGNIAVIARSHKELRSLIPYLEHRDIPVAYEKQQNVLEESHIHQLIQMARLVEALRTKQLDYADELMAEVLSYPFWEIDRETIWSISIARSEQTQSSVWMEKLRQSSNPALNRIARFFLALVNLAAYEPIEYMMDYLIGEQVPYGEEAESEELRRYNTDVMRSPFKAYYFSDHRRQTYPVVYFSFLSSLRVFLQAIYDHKRGERIVLSDMLQLVDRHLINGQPITDTSPFRSGTEAVELLTAHKAKGLEYSTVFVLNCTKDRWMPKPKGDTLPFPPNLPIKPGGEAFDDQLRLFFVALTRAEDTLYLPRFMRDQKGRETLGLPFLNQTYTDEAMHLPSELPSQQQALIESWEVRHQPPFSTTEEQLLEPILEKYQMSATHLNTFLDVTRNGPQRFLQEHLLRFPQAQTPQMAYGTAIHATINRLYVHLQHTHTWPTEDEFLTWYTEELYKTRLRSNQYETLLAQGKDALKRFYYQWGDWVSPEHYSEFDMKQQEVRIGEAHLSGKIDILVPKEENCMEVHDIKTGKPEYKWNMSQEKMLGYYRQLVFYKILVENARDFGPQVTVSEGVLDFVVPEQDKPGVLSTPLEESDAERLTQLIEAVYHKIENLDFPDVSGYSQDANGIRQFEGDLLEGKI